jgi:predicted nucleic acid-binding protein
MIHLDTNILIDFLNYDSPPNSALTAQLQQGTPLSCSAIAWSEFCNGPCSAPQQKDILTIIANTILPFDQSQAELAAHLFNETGRRRSSRADCMIAAAAILSKASIATYNTQDFQSFTPYGLEIFPLS